MKGYGQNNQLYADPMKQLLSRNKYEELHKHLVRLSWRQQIAIQLRFWENYSIFQVAFHLEISWKEADDLIESALSALKDGLMKSMNHSAMPSAA